MIVAPVPIAAGPDVPDSSNTETTFDAQFEAFNAWLKNNAQPEINALGTNVYNNAIEAQAQAVSATDQAALALGSAIVAAGAGSFKGDWVSLTGALARPASVKHLERFWLLLADLPDVTAATPGVSASWTPLAGVFQQVKEARSTAAISAGALALDLANSVTSVALTSSITSLTLSANEASSTVVQSHTLELVADGTARTVVWPAGNGTSTLLFKWPNGVAPTLTSTSGKLDSFFFKSRTQWLWDGYVIGQNS